MIVSEARIEANRRNARLSTGPKTAEGKARSRANAIKHGFAASVVVIEDPEMIQARSRDWYWGVKPQSNFHIWMLDEASVTSLKIDRIERQERRIRDKRVLRAELCWDDDRRLEAIRLGANLRGDPEGTVETLKRTPQGCEWLMTRWAMLAHAADLKLGWTTEQKRLAFDLLATPEEFRQGFEPGASLDFNGKVIFGSDDPASVARRELAALRERRDLVESIDEAVQALALTDLGDDDADPELKKLRRYETALHNRLRWCLAQINARSPYPHPGVQLEPRTLPEATLPAEPPPIEKTVEALAVAAIGPCDHPPFDLTPDEYPGPGQVADIPAIVAARAEKKRQKAESRRDARRRKIEKLREAS